jgi:hypothetical protein
MAVVESIMGASALKLARLALARKLEWHSLQGGNKSLSKVQDGALVVCILHIVSLHSFKGECIMQVCVYIT